MLLLAISAAAQAQTDLGRDVGAARQRLRAAGRFDLLSREHASDSTTVRGTLFVPVVPILYANTGDSASLVRHISRDRLETRLFSTAPAAVRGADGPYSIYSYYLEQSNGLFRIIGNVFDWKRVPKPDSVYEGAPPCQGGFGEQCGSVPLLIQHIVEAWDPVVDFGLYDNDGPDNHPNSGDDDGFVDVLVMLHPGVDGSCAFINDEHREKYGKNIRAFRSRLPDWGPVATKDSSFSKSAASGKILVADYIIQGGQGGDDGCTPMEPQALNIIAHELGHTFGLPDLYDTRAAVTDRVHYRGIGNWGLMGTASQVPIRPAHMSAWAKAELGWVSEVLIARDTVLDISPVETSDTVYVLPIRGSDEYLLLSNRQLIGADRSLADQSPSRFGGVMGPGLLIVRVDSAIVRERGVYATDDTLQNTINAGQHGGVVIEQADGRQDLEQARNNGDAGDPFPGSTGTTSFVYPSGGAAGRRPAVTIDAITQLPSGAVRVHIRFAPRRASPPRFPKPSNGRHERF